MCKEGLWNEGFSKEEKIVVVSTKKVCEKNGLLNECFLSKRRMVVMAEVC